MGFNFKEAQKQAAALLKSDKLFAVILGPSGGGKSTACGTLGTKTLYLFSGGEDHGPRNAAAMGGEIVPINIDVFTDDGKLDADATYGRLLEIVSDSAGIKAEKFGAVVLDGIPELESIILRTNQFVTGCLTDKGKHNSFAESKVMTHMIKQVLDRLKKLQYAGLHVAMTCKLDVKSLGDYAAISEASPRLLTYSVAEDFISKCADVLVVSKIDNGEERKHMFQFLTDVSRVSKDMDSGKVRKMINFSPRISGLKQEEYPEFVDADLTCIIRMKAGDKDSTK